MSYREKVAEKVGCPPFRDLFGPFEKVAEKVGCPPFRDLFL